MVWTFCLKTVLSKNLLTCPISHTMCIFHMKKHGFLPIRCYTFYILWWIQKILEFSCVKLGSVDSMFCGVLKSVLKANKFYNGHVTLKPCKMSQNFLHQTVQQDKSLCTGLSNKTLKCIIKWLTCHW